MFLDKRVKNLDTCDLACIKWSVIFFVLFMLGIFPIIMKWISLVNPWYFFIVFAILAIRPLYRFFK